MSLPGALYRSDPQAFANLAQLVPRDRQVRCRDGWDQISAFLAKLLKPWTQ